MAPSRSRVNELADMLARSVGGEVAGPAWTPDLVSWRFFHPIGPKHLVVADRAGDFLALVSLGRHRGARVARIVELRTTRVDSCRAGFRSLKAALRLLGGDVLLGFCADSGTIAILSEAGLRPQPGSADTWLYIRRRAPPVGNSSFSGAAGDFGFDAM
jgi:hypothetical protein